VDAQRSQRRLAAILAADVVGFSRLMGEDESGTLAALKAHRQELIEPSIAGHDGRIFKLIGDGLLAEFPSAVEAVTCAVEIQRAIGERNSGVADDRRITYRVGINLGDIIVDGDDIYGDGVNVAARLEGLAEPNGICVARSVFDQVKNKVDLGFEDLGEKTVKNIKEPVRVYRVLSSAAPGTAGATDLAQAERAYRDRLKAQFGAEAVYYVPLAATTTDSAPAPASKAPRSSARRRRRAATEYHEWIPVGEEIKQVKLDSVRDAVERYPCIVLLGEPGCGKTTALETLAYEYADRPDRLPVLLHLSEFTPGGTVEDFIAQGWGGAREAGHWGARDLAANLGDALDAGKLLFLFDALNEMPQEGSRDSIAALRRFIDRHSGPGNRFVVTCRVLDYGEALTGLQRVEIQPLSDEQIERFLRNELPEEWQALLRTLREDDSRHRLLDMARNPYLLTVMIDVFEEDGALSDNRADLMRRFTQILFDWARAKCPPEQWLDAELQVEALSRMAYEMQARSGFGTRVKTEQVKAVMPGEIQLDPNWPPQPAPPDRVLGLAANANIVEMPIDRLTVRFYHQLLQEYFAAHRMLQVDPAELTEFWRGPWLESDMPAWTRPENNYEPLPPPPPTGWEETTVLAAGSAPEVDNRLVEALLQVNPVLAGRCVVQRPGGGGDAALRQAVIDRLLAAIADPDVALRVRIAAGEVLGALGDPRPGEMVLIPAGDFLMGEGSERHALSLPDYRLGRYPLTNAEYRAFVEAGGYGDRRWWTDAGWNEIAQTQQEPRFWRDSRYNKPNQPALGLSWYECVAYCRWLSAETGQRYRLPTEAEWEKGARGADGRRFPWGDDFDPGRLNGRGPDPYQVCSSTPVGIYPTGASPFGLLDCVGNVWEWCATRWKKPFPYDTMQDEWQDAYLQGQYLRVLRGGSWYFQADVTRCTHRFRFQPYGWTDRGGCRLAAPV
jgi:formylglycine-generating enzyme required for sulfatase activity/class 3 adenylate cyclase